MASLQLLLNSILILHHYFIVTVLSVNEQYNLYSLAKFQSSEETKIPNPYVFHYDIELTLLDFENISNNYFNVFGKCDIIFKIIRPIISFEINLTPSMHIISNNFVMENDSEITFDWRNKRYTDKLSSYQEWVFDKKLQPGIYKVSLEYKDVIHNNEKGFYRTSYTRYLRKFNVENDNGQPIRWLVATNTQPNGGYRVFPCFELPGHRATFNISVKVHNKYQILTNMGTEHEHYLHPDGLQIKHFIITYRIPVYQIAILVYNYNYINEVQFTLGDKIYSRNSEMHIHYAKAVIANLTFLLQKEWPGIKDFWNPVINYALIPGFPYDSADGWRLVFLRENKVIYNKQTDTFGHKIAVTRFVAQKVMYQWLSNAVSLYNWSDLWVNDGISIFHGIESVNKSFPEYQMWNLFVVQDVHECLHIDTKSFLKPLYATVNSSEIDTTLYFTRYLKGSALMQMLYFMMPNDVFRQGVHSYNTAAKFKLPTVDVFWNTMQTAFWGDKLMFKSKTVKEVMDTWLENNYPILNVRTNYDMEEEDMVVSVIQENNEKFNWHKWWILVTWFTDHLIENSNTITPTLSKWLRPNERRKILTTLESTSSWIIVNTRRNGYYRVNYDKENWRRVGWFLLKNCTAVHVLNRAQLVDDSFHFVLSKKLDVKTYRDVIKFLSEDTDYIAWYPMLKSLEYISSIFAFNTKRIWELKVHLLSLLVPLLNQIGYDAKPNESKLTECLREEAIKWACLLGDPGCYAMAKEKLDWHLQNRATNILLPGWKRWVFCEGLVKADSLIWHNVARMWNDLHDDAMLQYLMCSQDYYIATQSFNTMKDESIIKHLKPQDEIIHFMYFLAKYANHTIIIEDILDDILIEKRPSAISEITALTIIINSIYNTDIFEKIENYATNKPPRIRSSILSKIEERKNQMSKVIKYSLLITIPETEKEEEELNDYINDDD